MSSYINDRRHFDSLAVSVESFLKTRDFKLDNELEEHLGCRQDSPVDVLHSFIEAATLRLMDLQILCVSHQYSHREECEKEIKDTRWMMSLPSTNPVYLTPVQLFTQIRCALYQIEIEHLLKVRVMTDEEKRAYSFYKGFNKALAFHICKSLRPAQLRANPIETVMHLPESRDAGWGIEG